MWTDEKTEELKRLRASGFTASHIARTLGTTRNAVLGKAFRMGLDKMREGRHEELKVSPVMLEYIRSKCAGGTPRAVVAVRMGVHRGTIDRVLRRERVAS